MRSDYMLYTVAVIFFAITIISIVVVNTETERTVSVVATVIFGLIFTALGFTLRPKATATVTTTQSENTPLAVAPPPPSPETQLTITTTTTTEEKSPAATEVIPYKLRLTKIKGIGGKRSDQLKALGINNVKDLSNASAKELAAKLDASPKTTARWITEAKELAEKA